MKIDFDIDIDMADRNSLLRLVNCVPAAINNHDEWKKHNTGVYFQNIPRFPIENFASIDHKQAESQGWFKVDFLNNSVYQSVRDEQHLDQLLNTEPMWELLLHEEIVHKLYHINNYIDVLQFYRPDSVDKLAMILAIIRPAKRHLIGKPFDEIQLTVWDKPDDNSYFFKKSHAYAFATAIVVQLNLLCEEYS